MHRASGKSVSAVFVRTCIHQTIRLTSFIQTIVPQYFYLLEFHARLSRFYCNIIF